MCGKKVMDTSMYASGQLWDGSEKISCAWYELEQMLKTCLDKRSLDDGNLNLLLDMHAGCASSDGLWAKDALGGIHGGGKRLNAPKRTVHQCKRRDVLSL